MLSLVRFPVFDDLIKFRDQVTCMGHLLFILVFVPFCQAKVLIVVRNELRLTFLVEKGVREEYFTAGQHLLFGVFLRFGNQLVDQHMEGHIFLTLEVSLVLYLLDLKALLLLYLRDAALAALKPSLASASVARKLIFLLLGRPMEARAVAAAEWGLAFDIPLDLLLLLHVLSVSRIVATSRVSQRRTAIGGLALIPLLVLRGLLLL